MKINNKFYHEINNLRNNLRVVKFISFKTKIDTKYIYIFPLP